MVKEETNDVSLLNRGESNLKIGTINKDNTIIYLFDKNTLEINLKLKDFFSEIESIKIDYGVDNILNKKEAYLTIIGKDPNDFTALAFQAELFVIDDDLYIGNPNTQPQTFAKHSCKGTNCRSCLFKRAGFLNLKVVGCLPCTKPNNTDKESACDHSLNGGATALEISKEVISVIK